ncbi:MAG: hypothetical protein MMC33_010035 [Icmadophila ericetorum]|nr:hypothetical protein [Icmadophila ericetorum]
MFKSTGSTDNHNYSGPNQYPQHIQPLTVDGLAQSRSYSLHHAQSNLSGRRVSDSSLKSPTRVRHHPYENAHAKVIEGRRRSSEHGNGLKDSPAACDGKTPCAHCVEFGLSCEYFRERKKRGKASRKDLAQQQAAAESTAPNNPSSPGAYSSDDDSPSRSRFGSQDAKGALPSPAESTHPISNLSQSTNETPQMDGTAEMVGNIEMMHEIPSHRPVLQQQQHLSVSHSVMPDQQRLQSQPLGDRGSQTPTSLSGFGLMHDYGRPNIQATNSFSGLPMGHNGQAMHPMPPPLGPPQPYSSYNDSPYHLASPHESQLPPPNFSFERALGSPLNYMTSPPIVGSPNWAALASPPAAIYSPRRPSNPPNSLRYPVLQPLLPHISNILPISLACDLLELYFTSSPSAPMHPSSPYLLGYVFRKRSFLHPLRPRACSPALLCSMLWVGAQTSDASFLTSPPAARGQICQKLLELTVSLLRPLIHGSSSADLSQNYGNNTIVNGIALGGLGVAMTNDDHIADGGANGRLDDVATYLHLATVISASEYKAASLRWWNAAWSLARELKLGRELPPNPANPMMRDPSQGEDVDADGDVDLDVIEARMQNGNMHIQAGPGLPAGCVSEEEREVRRRIWWLLYTMDRHLALCYNRPLFLLDIECDGLLQPIDDKLWQAGEVFSPGSNSRRRGPQLECTGHSIFGYFLPLMTILGEIVDLNHAKNHPRFGVGFRGGSEWDNQAEEITQQLERYGRSLQEFQTRQNASLRVENEQIDGEHRTNNGASTPSARSTTSVTSRMTESVIQTKIVVAYGTQIMHVLHILLTGKWDPISLLDDNDLWISSQSFVSATGHAVKAAEAIQEILEYDPDLSFMPFFFGIYLLQGSFLLLLIADKLQGEASPAVIKACETIVRAHEACVVTLNTEYQRNFRKVMRSALAQVKGRVPDDFGEQQLRRREVLALYRWTGDGTGLAL